MAKQKIIIFRSPYPEGLYKIIYPAEWWDERAESDDTGLGKKFGHFSDTSDIFFSVGISESQIGIQTETHVISIEAECRNASSNQVIFQRKRQRRFTRAGEPYIISISFVK